jgi:hypothetical protein
MLFAFHRFHFANWQRQTLAHSELVQHCCVFSEFIIDYSIINIITAFHPNTAHTKQLFCADHGGMAKKLAKEGKEEKEELKGVNFCCCEKMEPKCPSGHMWPILGGKWHLWSGNGLANI